MTEQDLILRIAKDVSINHGTCYLVGGYVRDTLLGIPSKDYDLEIHGIDPEKLKDILSRYGKVQEVGAFFGVYKVKGFDIDIAIPRKEKKTGETHKDFDITVDPFIGTYLAAIRRDFTINALMQNVLTGEIIDHFGGINDLKNHLIRHINDESFCEDPLRVLRCAQFASRFEFDIDPKTIELCSTIDLSTLSKERVFAELEKALLKSKKPSIFFNTLRKMNQLDIWFKEVKDLIDVPQNLDYHPEGDVWNHTMNVIDSGVTLLPNISKKNHLKFLLSCLCHDFGKTVSTTIGENGVIHSYGHENTGVEIADKFLKRLTNDKELINYVKSMVKHHMKPHRFIADNSSIKASNKTFDEVVCGNDLIYLAMADQMGAGNFDIDLRVKLLKERLLIYEEINALPYVTSGELMDLGYHGKALGDALKYAHKLKLSGVPKVGAIKQIEHEIKK